MIEIWTVGHSNRTFEEFLSLLLPQQIRALADVRRFPGSRKYPHFGQAQLSGSLHRAGIQYFHFAQLRRRRKALADSPNTAWRNAAFRGFADYMGSPDFTAGIERLLEIGQRYRTAIMCAEALWWQCHRGLIADFLKSQGHLVWNILRPGKLQEHPFTSAAGLVSGALSYAARAKDLEFGL